MNWRMIFTLVYKDTVLFCRNRLFGPATLLALIAYAVLYFVMPNQVDDVHEVALYGPVIPPSLVEVLAEEGIAVREMASEKALKQAVADGKFGVGIVLPGHMIKAFETSERARIRVYFGPGFPGELEDAFVILLQEMAHRVKGEPMMVEATEEILGPDMTGKPIPLRNRTIPLFALLVLMTETMGIATLITEEVAHRTLQALLITPLRIGGLTMGKSITGVGLAFVQVMLLMTVIGGLGHEPVLVSCTLLLGALLVTGVGFMMASVSRDLMSVSAWGTLAMLILMVPSFSILFPGMVSQWVKLIPSYYLIDTLHQLVNFKAGWYGVWQNLLVLSASSAAFIWIGTMALTRRWR